MGGVTFESIRLTKLLDGKNRVIAASDGVGVLTETYDLNARGTARGYYVERDRLVAHALTPGYETYRGLGWSGVIEYRLAPGAAQAGRSAA